jgi:hypothetical protein
VQINARGQKKGGGMNYPCRRRYVVANIRAYPLFDNHGHLGEDNFVLAVQADYLYLP